MTTLIIDNFDSFTWNLFQLVAVLGGEPRVVRNDAIDADGIRRLAPRRIVLSPGPGRPDDPARVGVSRAALDLDVPVLGVCLGHQLIVTAAGGRIVRAATPTHGKTSLVEHEGDGLMHGLPRPFPAMRYHSLAADPGAMPPELAVTAWCKDGTVMAVRHRRRPIFGVQFHPESIGTPHGADLVRAFLRGDFS
ncbi:MAG: aminodeoxychorismate/anthranilate synthase component II [Labilithrix sp.]|nr:aminodeoxychorismate/anthranilate synthase component II [Labilithrix sp.]MCW5816101.1 aminodeoxychorismate/anthranilate synthase component II [Labilithrix sp.]